MNRLSVPTFKFSSRTLFDSCVKHFTIFNESIYFFFKFIAVRFSENIPQHVFHIFIFQFLAKFNLISIKPKIYNSAGFYPPGLVKDSVPGTKINWSPEVSYNENMFPLALWRYSVDKELQIAS